MTDELVAFLRARLDEDEQAARDATPPQDPLSAAPGHWNVHLESKDDGWAVEDASGLWAAVTGYPRGKAAHIARHDPARVLRDVEAKRRILNMELPGYYDNPYANGWDDAHGDVLYLLALPYADHPDYRQEWTEWTP